MWESPPGPAGLCHPSIDYYQVKSDVLQLTIDYYILDTWKLISLNTGDENKIKDKTDRINI